MRMDSEKATTGWMPEPDKRGTISIIWQSVSTILLCVYVSIHLHIPPYSLKLFTKVGQKAFWVGVGVLCPELISAIALEEYLDAKELAAACKSHGLSLSLSQAFYIRSGGVIFRYKATHPNNQRQRIEMFASLVPEASPDKMKRSSLALLVTKTPSDEEISDFAKMDVVGKLVALMQSFWAFVQILTRLIQRISISLLETVTFAYIVMAAFLWFLWFSKPYGVTSTALVDLTEEHVAVVEASPEDWKIHEQRPHLKGFPIIWSALGSSRNRSPTIYFVLFLCAVFGGLHLLAWRYEFPSIFEAWAWRSTSIAIVILPSAILVHSYAADNFPITRVADMSVLGALLLLYTFCRCFMIFECFLSFRQVPADIYQQVSWASYIGHWGS